MDFDSDKLLYKSSDVAKMLGITQPTLKKLVKNGEIDCVTISTHRYFTKKQIMDYIDSNTYSASDKEGLTK